MLGKLLLQGALLFVLVTASFASGGSELPLKHADINLHDQARLQRGAKLFMNYCAGCHSLKYMRYNQMAVGIGLVDDDNKLDQSLLIQNLIFTNAKPASSILSAIDIKASQQWFGVEPPDLSLIARQRGADWLFTYLTTFYRDDDRPLGSNNWLSQDVAMPNVLANLQGEQVAVMGVKKIPWDGGTKDIEYIKHLQILKVGEMSEQEFNSAINDVVNFLVYVGEPVQLQRKSIGYGVLLFLLLLAGVTFMLKREYWRDIK